MNGIEVSRESFKKILKLLNFWKQTIQSKILEIPGGKSNGTEILFSKILMYPSRFSSLLEIQTRIFYQMESAQYFFSGIYKLHLFS